MTGVATGLNVLLVFIPVSVSDRLYEIFARLEKLPS